MGGNGSLLAHALVLTLPPLLPALASDRKMLCGFVFSPSLVALLLGAGTLLIAKVSLVPVC